MSRRRTVRGLGALLGALAIALQAFWPLLAQGAPRTSHLVPLCTVDGITHYVEVPAARIPAEKHCTSHREHCQFCPSGAGLALVVHHSSGLVDPRRRSAAAIHPKSAIYKLRQSTAALPRAPPQLLVVAMNPDETRRNDEKASALRPGGCRAMAAELRERVLRGGILLG